MLSPPLSQIMTLPLASCGSWPSRVFRPPCLRQVDVLPWPRVFTCHAASVRVWSDLKYEIKKETATQASWQPPLLCQRLLGVGRQKGIYQKGHVNPLSYTMPPEIPLEYSTPHVMTDGIQTERNALCRDGRTLIDNI